MKKSTKIMSVLLAAACAASMTGCGGSGSTATTAAASEAATEAASSEEAKAMQQLHRWKNLQRRYLPAGTARSTGCSYPGI
ncbi:MAG: hypothetical protein ACLRRJ_14605 [Clostridium sp.]